MALQRFSAIVRREGIEIGRRRAPFVLRTTYAAGVALTVFMIFAANGEETTGSQLGFAAYYAFFFTTVVQSIVVLVLGSVLGVASAAEERRQHTLGLLLLSRLRHAEIVTGKLVALLAQIGMVVLAALPLFGILGWAGGLDYRWLAKGFGLSLALALLGLCVGLACGFGSRRAGLGHVAAMLVLAAIVLGPAWPAAGNTLDTWIPGAIWQVGTQGVDGGTYGTSIGWTVVIALAFAALATLALRRAGSHATGGGLRGGFERLDAWLEKINIGNIRLSALWPGRSGHGNPVSSIASTSTGFGLGRYRLRMALASIVLSLLLASFVVVGASWAIIVGSLGITGLIVVPLASGSHAIAGERTSKSLVALLSTPLSARTILAGKLWSALKLMALVAGPPLLALLLVSALDATVLATRWTAGMFVLGAEFVVQWAAAYCLALAASLTARRPLRAGVVACGLLLIVNVVPSAFVELVRAAMRGGTSASVGTVVCLVTTIALFVLWFVWHRYRFLLGLFVGVLGCSVLAGLLIGVPFPGDALRDIAAAAQQALGYSQGRLLMMVHVGLVTWLVWQFTVRRFDVALGRAP